MVTANPRDPAFEEAVREQVWDVAAHSAIDNGLYRNNVDAIVALCEARVTRAVRDTRQECAQTCELVEHEPGDGFYNAIGRAAKAIRSLSGTPERLYTEEEKEAAYQAGVRAGALVQQGLEDVKAGRVTSLGSFAQYVDDDDPATPAPETSHG